MPIAAVAHKPAAVVNPITPDDWRKITPAPIKPIPIAMAIIIREGSKLIPVLPKKELNNSKEIMVKRQVPKATKL